MTSSLSTPLGELFLTSNEEGIRLVNFSSGRGIDEHLSRLHRSFRRQLKEYFEGKRRVFDLGIDLNGTPFQNEVWKLTSRIPFGETRTYREIAEQLGDWKKSRAVGLALGANPILVVVPCHRVIGEDGGMHGYAAETWRKQWLLNHEYSIISGQLDLFKR
jgi:methylated-DNA-[protein]-cysteine S-methyltransferase